MDYNLKKYKVLKFKNYLKNCSFLLIFHSSKISSKDYIKIEQTFKKLKLKNYKILNGISSKTLKNSIYIKYYNLISGLMLFIKPSFKSTSIKLIELKKDLKFLLLTVKLNNKMYSVSQINSIKEFSYKKNIFDLYKLLAKTKKNSYVLKKINRNNVI